jgi:SWI/SNF-related matrix-associated actin-dependent regulator of chromatin subfamily A3
MNSYMLRHQMKALTFMIQREQAWSYEESQDNLWVREVDETGDLMFVTQNFEENLADRDRYTNLVTENSQRTEPHESRGGLLADQMGLGKSLTMISLIASSRAQSNSSVVFTAQGTICRIKSTIIVVPYSCE